MSGVSGKCVKETIFKSVSVSVSLLLQSFADLFQSVSLDFKNNGFPGLVAENPLMCSHCAPKKYFL